MEIDDLRKLQYDKRLRLRNGWISKEDADRYLESLPDVSDKIALEEAEEVGKAVETEGAIGVAAEGSEHGEHDKGGEGAVGERAQREPVVAAAVAAPADPASRPVDASVEETPVNPLFPPPFEEI